MANSNITIVFMGGSLTIQRAGTYVKDGETKQSSAKVKLNQCVDKYGNCSPAVFASLVKAVSSNNEAMKLLDELSKQ